MGADEAKKHKAHKEMGKMQKVLYQSLEIKSQKLCNSTIINWGY